MKKWVYILCFNFLQLSGLIVFASNKEDFDVQHLKLDLSFNWQQKQAFGTAAYIILISKSTNQIILDGAYLTIKSIIEETTLQPLNFVYDSTKTEGNIVIEFPQKLALNNKVKLVISYNSYFINHSDPNNIGGSFGKGLRFQQPTFTTPTKKYQIWSSTMPNTNKYWYPCKESIEDIRTTEINLTVEEKFQAIASGVLKRVNNNKNGTITYSYKSDKAYPNHLTAIAVGEYKNVKKLAGKTVLNIYGYGDEVEAIKASTERLPEMVRFFESYTAMPFPFASYSMVMAQDYPFPGLTSQNGINVLSDNFIDDYRTHKDYLYLWDVVEANALAGEWFGNVVIPKTWNDIWIANGFSRFMDEKFTAFKVAKEESKLYNTNFDYNTVINDWYQNKNHSAIVSPPINGIDQHLTNPMIKEKASLILHTLELELGESIFKKVVQRFLAQYAYKQVTTADFIKVVNQVSAKNMDWFFKQWFYTPGHPIFTVDKKYNSKSKELIVTIKQKPAIDTIQNHATNFYYSGKMLIEIDNEIKTIELKADSANSFSFKKEIEPSFIHFDVGGLWVKEISFKKSYKELIAQALKSNDILAKWDAIVQLATIAKDSSTSKTAYTEIQNTLIQIINSKAYWRLKYNTLWQLNNIVSKPFSHDVLTTFKKCIMNDSPWVQTAAISILGNTKDSAYANLYINALSSQSERVVNAAANALGKTKYSKAFEILMQLENKPSWKNQSRISALNGLQQLGDERALDYVLACIKDNTSPRWYLATPTWDYPFAAVNTLMALQKGDLAFTILMERFKKSLLENDINDIFQNVQLINLLKEKRGKGMYVLLKEKFKNDRSILESTLNYEIQFEESLKN